LVLTAQSTADNTEALKLKAENLQGQCKDAALREKAIKHCKSVTRRHCKGEKRLHTLKAQRIAGNIETIKHERDALKRQTEKSRGQRKDCVVLEGKLKAVERNARK
jgi:hypothetical protein